MNKRGVFGRRNQQDKTVVEASTTEEWASAVKAEFGLHFTHVSPCKTDPPDCYANFEGRSISIELAELVDSNRLRESVAAIERGDHPPHHQGQAFFDSQWTKDRFLKALSNLIDKKTAKYIKDKLAFDVLIIHTDEPWLSPHQVKDWLAEADIEPTGSFHNAFFLMTYSPGYAAHWPVFRLFGPIASKVATPLVSEDLKP